LLAESTLRFALQDLQSFQQTVDIGQAQYEAGYISEGDYLKIKLQLLQFQTDVSSARLARVQALIDLRTLLGYDAVPANYDVVGDLSYQAVPAKVEDLQAKALQDRPDYRAAELGTTAAQSQILLAKANGKQDVTASADYSHTADQNSASFFVSFPIAIFNRNQGEIARTQYALTQAQETQASTSDVVLSDVSDAYEALRSNDEVVQLYTSGYLKEAQDSRDISEYAYKRGAASLLDFLDAERSYRAVQLAYRQALSSYMTALEQLKEAVGTRNLP
jgi:cobalt-zinc-cadmium efflux system outer membrane protein